MIRIAQIPEVGLPRIRPGENRFARIHVVTQPENPPPRRQHRIPLRCSSGILRRLEVVGDDTPERSCREILLPEKTLPVGFRRLVERLVVQQLRRPFGGVDLGDFGCHDEASDFEQFVRADLVIADRRIRSHRVAQAGVGIGCERLLPSKRFHKRVVLTCEQVVIEAHAR